MAKKNKSVLSNLNVLQGLFDADGSFEAKVYSGKQKPISFHVNIIFSQEEKEVLQLVVESLSSIAKISEREILNESGSISIGNSISLAFSNEASQALLKHWETSPPKAPTKYLDYRIATILVKVSQSDSTYNAATGVVNELLPNLGLEDEKIAGLSLLYLRYRMFGKIKDNKNPKLKPIETFYKSLNASKDEIDQSIAIGEQLYEPIKQDYETCQSTIQIDENYLLGYHIGDGSFWLQTQFDKNCKSFRTKFTWSLTDCKENLPLLRAIKNKLLFHNIPFAGEANPDKESGIVKYPTFCRLEITSIQAQEKWLALIKKWDWQNLPKVRQNQYDFFQEAYEIYNSKNFRSDLSLMEKVIYIKWNMNPKTNYKKQGTFETDIKNVQTYFQKTN